MPTHGNNSVSGRISLLSLTDKRAEGIFYPVGEQIPLALPLYVAPIRVLVLGPLCSPGLEVYPCWGLPGSGLRLPQENGVSEHPETSESGGPPQGCKDPTL